MTGADAVAIGDVREMVATDNLTRTQIVMYAGASGDYNPLHTDEVYATEVAGYDCVFAHGMLTMGMTGRIITDWFGCEQLRSFGAQFRAQVWPGDRLTTRAVITNIVEADGERRAVVELSTSNDAGTVVLKGSATVAVPRSSRAQA